MKLFTAICTLLLAFALAGCATSHTGPSLWGHAWHLTTLNGQAVSLKADQQAPTLSLDKKTLRASGFAGCNRFIGQVHVGDNNHIQFSKMGATLMACAHNMALESHYLKAFENISQWHIKDHALILNNDAGDAVLRFSNEP